jgi:hypothetical protein
MEGAHWLGENWLSLLDAVGVVAGLFFTATSIRADTKTRRISNLLTVTSNHREIWQEFVGRPELARVVSPSANVTEYPVTTDETEFVNFVILHLNSVYYAMTDGIVIKLEGLRTDVRTFFALPVPQAVWSKTKIFQNADFVRFVESCQAEC